MELGSTVTLTYTGTLEDGTVFGRATKESPMRFQTGMDMAIDGFEKEILRMNAAGEKKTFVVGQYDAYGEYRDDYVQQIPVEQIPLRDVREGQRVWMASDEGAPTPVTVVKVENDSVTFDLNHPLAVKDLAFEVEILEIEGAPEDFAAMREKRKRQQESLSAAEEGGEHPLSMFR